MRNTFVNTLFNEVNKHPEIYVISGDLGFGVLDDFAKTYPTQFINAGIAEQNMTLVAAGMALEGKHPYTYSIANFTTLRCLEQIRNDVAYHNLPVTIVSVGAGFAYGGLGMSHHATEDIGVLRTLPNMTLYTPCDPIETRAVTLHSLQNPSPSYIRLGRGGEKNLHNDSDFISVNKANLLCEGNDAAILVAGAIANEAVAAHELLKEKAISCAVWSFPCIKPMDNETVISLAQKHNILFTLEEHNRFGGFASIVADVLSTIQTNTRLVRFGLNDEYTSIVGDQDYLRQQYKMDSISITNKIVDTLV